MILEFMIRIYVIMKCVIFSLSLFEQSLFLIRSSATQRHVSRFLFDGWRELITKSSISSFFVIPHLTDGCVCGTLHSPLRRSGLIQKRHATRRFTGRPHGLGGHINILFALPIKASCKRHGWRVLSSDALLFCFRLPNICRTARCCLSQQWNSNALPPADRPHP